MPNTNELNSVFSMAVEQQLKAMLNCQEQALENVRITSSPPPPHPIALALKSLAAFIFKYVLRIST